jgi:hypothetical protein
MGFTIKEKAFLLHYFRKRVKQESEDWPYFVPPYTEEFQARQTSEPDRIGYQQVYQCLKIIVPNFSES